MALNGAKTPQLGSKLNLVIAQIHKFIDEKRHRELYEFIKNCKQASMADEIYQVVFAKWLPGSWLAFLRNKHLNHIIQQKHIIAIVGKASEVICHPQLSEDRKKYYHLVLVAIARNAEWCRMVSYRFFLNYISISPLLLEHVIFDLEFITHLDFVHIGMLFNQISDPQEQNVILEYLDDLLDGNSTLHHWALETAKHMAIHCYDFNQKVKSPSCETIVKVLKSSFRIDKSFALDVLKRPQLYQLFDLADEQAYRHPLLSKADNLEIMIHLREKAPMLAYQYSLLDLSPEYQEERNLLKLTENMHALSLNDRSSNVVIQQESTDSRNPTNQKGAILRPY